jgi:SAM-dependent methyltransferase
MSMTGNSYIIRGGIQGRERLRLLSRVMAPSTLALLDRVGIEQGMRCLDAGCGGGDVTLEIARRVGANGQVVGLDRDPVAVDIVAAEARAAGVSQVRYRQFDILADDLPEERYDVVYVRFLLTHLSDPAAAIRRLRELLKPGGLLVVEDIDLSGHFIHPPSAAMDDFLYFHREAARLRGADSDIGPRLPGMLEAAGIGPVEMHVAQPAGLRGEVKLIAAVTMEAIAEAVIATGLATRARIDASTDELYRLANDQTTVMSTVRVIQTWGRRNESAA